jgi:RNA polymerase sigma factor (TIGR02999 family)
MPKPPRSLLEALARDLTPAESIRFDRNVEPGGPPAGAASAGLDRGATRVSESEQREKDPSQEEAHRGSTDPRSDLSRLLDAAGAGDARAADAIVPLVYDELRVIAAAQLRRMRPGATLDATSLVNEAYLRLVGKDTAFANRRHFFFAAARAMRDVLVEHARRGQRRQEIHRDVALDPARAAEERGVQGQIRVAETMLAIDELLPKLQQADARAHDVVLLRFFCGLDTAQIADSLGVAPRTVERDWRFARSWLFDALRQFGGLPDTAQLCAFGQGEG